MPGQTSPENPYLFPSARPTFFQDFVGRQDEAVACAVCGSGDISTMDGLHQASIIQVRVADSNLYRSSMLSPHELRSQEKGAVQGPAGSPDWLLGVFSLCLVLLVIARMAFQRRFDQILNAFIRPRHLSFLVREGNLMKDRITPPLLILHLVSYGLLFYLMVALQTGTAGQRWPEPRLFFFLLAAYAAFYFLRMIVIQLLSVLFATRETTHAYLINSMVMDEVTGIFLLPLSLALMVSRTSAAERWFAVCLGLIMLFLAYRLIRNFMVGLSNVKFSSIYLFLYLCTVEILPLLVIGKLINDWL